MNYGRGTDLKLKQFALDGEPYEVIDNAAGGGSVEIRRVDNQDTRGNKDLIFLARVNANDKFTTRPSNPDGTSMGDVLNSAIVTVGSDNTFSNDRGPSSNNIERISFLRNQPIVSNDMSKTGMTILERGGNDDFQIAAVTAVNAQGVPTAWGPMVKVAKDVWGTVIDSMPSVVMGRHANESAYRPVDVTGAQRLAGVYISFADLGISAGQTVYGYSILPNDINNPNGTVTNTSGFQSGIDLISGSFASGISPTANPKENAGPKGQPQSIDLKQSYASGDNLTKIDPSKTVLEPPESGSVSDDGLTVTVPGEGRYVLDRDNGTVRFEPDPDFVGEATPIGYRVYQTNGQSAASTITPTVRPGPSATPDEGATPQNVDKTINPLANDTPGKNADDSDGSFDTSTLRFPTADQPEGSTVSEDGKTITVPGEGVYTVGNDGTVTFDPEPAFSGTAKSIRYEVDDSHGNTTGSTITMTVNEVKPTANDDSASTPYNTPVKLPGATNDDPGDPGVPIDASQTVFTTTDQPDGATVSEDGKTITVPDQGTYAINDDGTITFTPADGYTGTTSPVTYQITDANGTTDTATATVTVRPGPAASPDEDRTPQGVDKTVNPLANDTPGKNADDSDGSFEASTVRFPNEGQPGGSTVSEDGKTITVPGEGAYTANDDGTVTFDPEPQFTGTATSVRYLVDDSNGNTTGSTITITVDPVTPNATSDAAGTPQNRPVTLPGARNDEPGDPAVPIDASKTVFPTQGQPEGAQVSDNGKTLTFPGQGVYTVNDDGSITFTPENGYAGTTTPVTYQIADANGTTDEAQVNVRVGDGPLAQPDDESTKQNVNVTLDPLANDTPGTNSDGSAGRFDPASVVFNSDGQPDGATAADNGKTLTVPGEGVYTIADDGTVTFDPEPEFTGKASPVRYTVDSIVTNDDGEEVRQPASSTITITVDPVRPVANGDEAGTPHNTPVTLPALRDDAAGDESAPLAPEATIFPAEGQPEGATISGDGKTLTMPGEGTWQVNDNGSVTFTPEDGFVGTTSGIRYQIEDANGTTDTAVLTVTVQDAPAARPDSDRTPQNVDKTVEPLANDTPGKNADGSDGAFDPASVVFPTDGQPTGAIVSADGKTITVPGEGAYTVNGDGTVTFDPEPAFTGDASPITYTVESVVTDAEGNEVRQPVSSTITITVDEVRPVATDDARGTPFNTPVTLPAMRNDDPGHPDIPIVASETVFPADGQPSGAEVSADGKTLTVPDEGTWQVNDNGSVTFTPVGGFIGTTSGVRYQITDENGSTDTATLTVTVQPGPSADADADRTPQDVDVTVDPLANDTPATNADGTPGAFDPATVRFPSDGQPTSATVSADGKSITVPGEGVYTIDPATGRVTFDPEPAFVGQAQAITYVVDSVTKDADGNEVRHQTGSTIVITVDAPPPPKPGTVKPDQDVTSPGTPVTVDVLRNDLPSNGAAWDPSTVRVIADDGSVVTTFTRPGVGTWVVNDDGTITFTPAPGYTGTAVITYQVADTRGAVYSTQLTIRVRSGASPSPQPTPTQPAPPGPTEPAPPTQPPPPGQPPLADTGASAAWPLLWTVFLIGAGATCLKLARGGALGRVGASIFTTSKK